MVVGFPRRNMQGKLLPQLETRTSNNLPVIGAGEKEESRLS